MNRSEGGVTIAYRTHDHTNPDEIVDFVELPPLHHHLFVDRIEVLFAAGDVSLDFQFFQAKTDVLQHLGEVDLALRCSHRHHIVDGGVTLGMQRSEAEILQLTLDFLDAEPVR